MREGGVAGKVRTRPGMERGLRRLLQARCARGQGFPRGQEKNVAMDEATTREMSERKTAPGLTHLPSQGGGDVAGSGLWQGGREESGSDEVICEREEGFSPGMGNPREGVCAQGFGAGSAGRRRVGGKRPDPQGV